MKKATFTLLRPPNWLPPIDRSAFMVVCIWCLLGIPITYANATIGLGPGDTIAMDYVINDTTSNQHILTDCADYTSSNGVLFTDEGSIHGNYGDGHLRRDTVEICPQDQWHYTRVVFSDF